MWNRLGALILCGCFLVGCAESKNVDAKVTMETGRFAPPGAPNLGLPADENNLETPQRQFNTEAYDHVVDNPFLSVANNPLSTFSIDVDTASYSNVRRYITGGQLPPPGAVRIEEMLNYFAYSYPAPVDGVPFSANVEVADYPWNTEHRLVRIGLKGREIPVENRPVSNLVFLVDVSGSMQQANKLPLLKSGMKLLVDQLTENDQVAIVVYAGDCRVLLNSTTADQKQVINRAFDSLQAGGSTNGASGIDLAYQMATDHFVQNGTNRVILCTDGDFNVGITDQSQLVRLIESKAKSGVFLSVLGLGMGNYKDATLEKLADKGNGNYAYIDTLNDAKKVLVEQMQGTLITIAKDVKIQVEFNPTQAAAYRLIGYENRLLAKEDFNDDRKDAGEIGAGHTVTALYEVIPPGKETAVSSVDPLKYQANKPVVEPVDGKAEGNQTVPVDSPSNDELLTLKLRYKQPEGDTSALLEVAVTDSGKKFAEASSDFAWAAAVAAFGMKLRDSEFAGNATLPAILEIAQANQGEDTAGYRGEFIRLIQAAIPLKRSESGPTR